jgi:tungstate transport system ATP-binding protein
MTAYHLNSIEAGHNGFSLTVDDLQLDTGCMVAVVGPNGSGKTTLLNVLAFMVRPSCGTVTLSEQPIRYDTPRALLAQRRKIGYLMQNPCLFNMSVRRNIEYGLRLRGTPRRVINQRVAQIIEELELTELEHRNARDLSGGEVQLVSLARTLVLQTSVLLLDEPTGNIDKARVGIVEKRLADISESNGVTVIFTTHSDSQAKRMAHRSIHISAGCLRSDEPISVP